jgi:PAS domain-containing protein
VLLLTDLDFRYMFDRDGNPKYVNDAYLRLIGLDRETFEQAASRGLA